MSTDPEFNLDLDRLVWGARGIAEIIGRNERQAFHLLESGYLDADKVGSSWVSSPRRLLFGKRTAVGAADAKRSGGRR